MSTTAARLAFSLTAASSTAAMSVLMVRHPDQIGAGGIVLFPGGIIAAIVSGNVHDFSMWVLAAGNFAFYFGLVWLICSVYMRLTRKR